MKPAAWRALALLFITAAVGFVCYQLTIPEREDFGIAFSVPAQAPGSIRVTSVTAGSQAAKAGIRPGDVLSYGPTAYDRARVVFATAGSRVTVTVNGRRDVTMTAHNAPHIALPPGTFALRLAFLAVAALLAWRRPDDPAARALVVFLACYGLAISMSKGVLGNPLLSLIVLQMGTGLLFLVGTGAAAVFAATFPSGSARPAPRTLAILCQVLVAMTALALIAGEWVPRSGNALSFLNAAFRASFVLIGLLVFTTLVMAYVQGEAAERQRRRWVFLLLGVGLIGPVADVVVQATIGINAWVDEAALLTLAVLPIGLAYVILRHRVLDVGFVLNRAVVYASVSICIVGVFLILETLTARYVEQHNHVESIALQLVVALGLGFSVRFIHARVDRFVDTIFFRERHEAESAMREFAHDAPYITDSAVLMRRCVEIVRARAKASNAGIWMRQDDRTYAQLEGTFADAHVDENDPAIVAMRARHVVADLYRLQSAVPGVLAFPMIVRGELTGVLACGAKIDDETYAPDERDALSAMATAVGHGLDGLRIVELERTVERLLAGERATQGAMGTF